MAMMNVKEFLARSDVPGFVTSDPYTPAFFVTGKIQCRTLKQLEESNVLPFAASSKGLRRSTGKSWLTSANSPAQMNVCRAQQRLGPSFSD